MTGPDVTEEGSPSRTLDQWIAALAEELEVTGPFDVAALLDVARDVAHAVARPAAPLSLFLVGLAAGRAGGDPADVAAACERATDLAGRWAGA